MSMAHLQRKRHYVKRLVLVVVAAIATAVAPLAVASASSHKTSHKTVRIERQVSSSQ